MLPFWNPSDAFRSGSYFKPSIRTHSFCCPRLETQLYLELCAGAENGSPLQYSCLENPTDRGAYQATAHGITESDMTDRLTLSFSSLSRFVLLI